jgi:hypothetical protein
LSFSVPSFLRQQHLTFLSFGLAGAGRRAAAESGFLF